jgi:histone H3
MSETKVDKENHINVEIETDEAKTEKLKIDEATTNKSKKVAKKSKKVTENSNTVTENSNTVADETKTKKYTSRTGSQTMHEIRKYQNSTKSLIPTLPFQKFVRDLISDVAYRDLQLNDSGGIKVESSALDGLQAYAENYMVKLMDRANANAIHAHRITVQSKDIKLVKFVQSRD